MSIRIVHTGDSHIDSDVHGSLNPATGINRAWESHARALKSAVTAALENEASAFIHAGDAFKNGRPTQEAALLFAETLLPLAENGIPVVLIDGNHERYLVPTAQRTATATVSRILSNVGGEVHSVERSPELVRLNSGIQVACLPWLSKTTILNLLGEEGTGLSPAEGDQRVTKYALDALDRMVKEADEGAPLLMASHVTMDDVRMDSLAPGHRRGSEMDIAHIFAEPILPREHVEDLPFSYVALSHIHARQRMGTKCFYAGSPDRLTMTDADDEKSVNLVTISEDNDLEGVDYIETDARPMTRIDLSADDAEERLEALEAGTLVGLILAPGDSLPPQSISKMITDSGAVLSGTKRIPLEKSETHGVVLPEKTGPMDALREWISHTEPEDVDPTYALALAAKLMED